VGVMLLDKKPDHAECARNVAEIAEILGDIVSRQVSVEMPASYTEAEARVALEASRKATDFVCGQVLAVAMALINHGKVPRDVREMLARFPKKALIQLGPKAAAGQGVIVGDVNQNDVN
jgi:hypothetical protein